MVGICEKDHINVYVYCDRKLYECVSLHCFYEHATKSMTLAWPVTEFKSLWPVVKNSVNNPHSRNEIEKKNMQEASLVIASQLRHA